MGTYLRQSHSQRDCLEYARRLELFPALWCFFSIESVVYSESFAGEWHFAIPGQRGRLHVDWKHGLITEGEVDEKEFVRLTLTARGGVDATQDPVTAIRGGLDLGHSTIVLSFKELMSDAANEYWGLT